MARSLIVGGGVPHRSLGLLVIVVEALRLSSLAALSAAFTLYHVHCFLIQSLSSHHIDNLVLDPLRLLIFHLAPP